MNNMNKKRESNVLLIVEDDLQTRELYRKILSSVPNADYGLQIFDSGIDALRYIVSDKPYRIAIFDHELSQDSSGDISGGMLKTISQSLHPETPVIRVSGSLPYNTGFMLNTLEREGVLSKPFESSKLIQILKEAEELIAG